MTNLSKKTPVRRRFLIQAYVTEGEWDVAPYRVENTTCGGDPCLAKYYGCHYAEGNDCGEGDTKVCFVK